MRGNRALVWLERVLFAVGVTCVSVFGLVTAGAAIYQHQQAEAFDQMRAIESLPPAPAHLTPAVAPAEESLIGMLDIPRLDVSTPIVAGDDGATLEIAAGHLPDTPRPWDLGNSAIAAHRDGLFRPLKQIRIGDHPTHQLGHVGGVELGLDDAPGEAVEVEQVGHYPVELASVGGDPPRHFPRVLALERDLASLERDGEAEDGGQGRSQVV